MESPCGKVYGYLFGNKKIIRKVDINMTLSKEKAQERLAEKCRRSFGCEITEATEQQLYKSLCMVIRDILSEKNTAFNREVSAKEKKKVYYMSMEFLVGTSLHNNLYNLGLEDTFKDILKKIDVNIEDLYAIEPDAGLGNGGLGRLAACFMDALASQNYPAMGYSIRYEYGLFKQKIVDGWQTELPDIWLPGGEVWLTQRHDKTYKIKFDGFIRENWRSL